MANDHVKMFTEEYGPIALQVSLKTGIAPSVLLAQWGMESDYGRKSVGHFNFGNIKDMSGAGAEATDNKTKSKDKYLNFESPEAFGDYYAHMMRRLYPSTLNTGTDISKYAEGLRTGVKGPYAEDENYEDAIRGAHTATTAFYKDPDELPKTRIPTQADQIRQERIERGENPDGPPPSAEAAEVVNPLVAAGAGALTSGVGQIFARPPEYAAKAPDLTKLEEAARSAKNRADIAEQRLQQRATSTTPITGGKDIAALEAEYADSKTMLNWAERELQAATLSQKAKVPPTPAAVEVNAPQAGSMASATPQIITDPNTPTMDQQTRAIQGTTEDGVTGRARQTTYNERTSQVARNAANQQQTLQALGQQGLIDPNKAMALTESISGSTPSGIKVSPDLAGETQQKVELEQRMTDDKAAQERAAQQREMQSLKNERALRSQEHSEAQRQLEQAQRAKTSGVTRAQSVAETAADRATAAQADLAAGRTAARSAPSAAARGLENVGAAVGRTSMFNPVGRTVMGGLGGLGAATGVNTLANIPIAELIKRWQDGDRSPELLDAMKQAAGATAQTAAGVGAMLPATGPKMNRIKGAGTLGTVGLGGYQLWKEFQDKSAQPPVQ